MSQQSILLRGNGARANVEFVSAYPNRALRAEDAYAAFSGDVLSNLLAHFGWHVTREYYVNDSGPQANALARSVYARLRDPSGFDDTETTTIAEAVKGQFPPDTLNASESEWLPVLRDAAISAALRAIKSDLEHLQVHFDVFMPDAEVQAAQTLPQLLVRCADLGLLLDAEGARLSEAPAEPAARLFLDTQKFGDTRPRPLTGAEGRYTYFAYDLAYHDNKLGRGFDLLFDVFRKDYGSYGLGLAAGVEILSAQKVTLETYLIEPVIAPLDDESAPRSFERAAPPALQDLLEAYGSTGLRRLMLSHPAGTPLEVSCDASTRHSLEAAEGAHQAALALPAAPQAETLLDSYPNTLETSLSDKSPQRLMGYADTLATALCAAGAASDLAKARLTECRALLGLSI